ncbi:hypothetical protein [Eisenbergiella sp.]
MTKPKRLLLIAAVLLAAATAAVMIYFFWFTPSGYRISVSIHGFSKLSDHVYAENGWIGEPEELLATLEEAKQRVTELFGGMESAPTLIICDNERKIKRLGGDHDTMTLLINGVQSYTSLSSEFLTADVLAHEMTHAETHRRIYQNSADTASIPVWFDEGLAVQNDYREPYSNETWLKLTDDGQNIPPLSEYGSGETFFSGSTEDRRARYCLAGHEVSLWLERNGRSGLLSLLKGVNQGESFNALYFAGSP